MLDIGNPTSNFQLQTSNFQHHFAFIRKLNRVVQQVNQNLPQTSHITFDRQRHVVVNRDGEFQFLLRRFRRQKINRRLDALVHIKWLILQIEFTRFDLGEIQNIIDDR